MESLFGIRGKDFVLMASDSTCGHSILKVKSGKIVKLHLLSLIHFVIYHYLLLVVVPVVLVFLINNQQDPAKFIVLIPPVLRSDENGTTI